MAWHPTWNEPPERRQTFFQRISAGRGPSALKVILLVTIGAFVLQMFGKADLVGWGNEEDCARRVESGKFCIVPDFGDLNCFVILKPEGGCP